jgi:protein phosphatase
MHPTSLESAELSDQGRVRSNNEDDCLRLPELGVFCVADGMGGAAGGDLASETITTTLGKCLQKDSGFASAAMEKRIQSVRHAINHASSWIKNFADEKGFGQMGSTVVALIFDPRHPARAVRLHAGDSRLYRYRARQLEQLTCDHTAGEALAAQSGQNLADIPARFRNELTRAVGINETVELTESDMDVRAGDLFLLCSDGLTRMVEDQAIARILHHHGDHALPGLAQDLIDEANRAGGKDNITVVLVRIGGWVGPSDAGTHETQATAVEASPAVGERGFPPPTSHRSPAARPQSAEVPGVVVPSWRRTTERVWLTPRRLCRAAVALVLVGVVAWFAAPLRARWEGKERPSARGGGVEISPNGSFSTLPLDAEAQILQARAAGDFKTATRLIDAWITASPNDPRARELKAKVQEAQDLQSAQYRLRLGEHENALRWCERHPGVRQFDDLAVRAREEAHKLAGLQAQFAAGDYSFLASLRQRPYAEKAPFRKLLVEGEKEAEILSRVLRARRASDWRTVLFELQTAAIPGLTNKPGFSEVVTWALRQNPDFVESPPAAADPRIQFERMLVSFGVLASNDSFLVTAEARREKRLTGPISSDLRLELLGELQRFVGRYPRNTSEYLYYSRSNYLDALSRAIQSWPVDSRP